MSAIVAARRRQFIPRAWRSAWKALWMAGASAILALSAVNAWGQGQNAAARADRGMKPNGSYSVSDIEAISLNNGNVNLSIPLASLPPMAGGKLSFTLSAHYNSKLWDMARTEIQNTHVTQYTTFIQDTAQRSELGGWRVGGAYHILFKSSKEDFHWLAPVDPSDPDYVWLNSGYDWAKLVLFAPDGATHELRPLGYSPFPGTRDFLKGFYKDRPDTVGAPITYYSFDGSFLWARLYPSGGQLLWEVFTNDGSRVAQLGDGSQRIYDHTGLNYIEITTTTDPANPSSFTAHYKDIQTGREIQHVFGGTAEYVKYQGPTGQWFQIALVWGGTQVQGKTYWIDDVRGNGQACKRAQLLTASISALREIDLPATEPDQPGKKFVFTYNGDTTVAVNQSWQDTCDGPQIPITQASPGWGELSEITMPSLAKIDYAYNLDNVHTIGQTTGEPNDLARQRITSKTLTHDGTPDVWTYDIEPLFGTVSGPDGSVTTESFYDHDLGYSSDFGGAGGLGGLSYKTASSGKKIVERAWQVRAFNGGTSVMPSGTLGVFNAVTTGEYTTIVDPANSANNKMSAKIYVYDYNGNMTQEQDYDWFDPSPVIRDSTTLVPTGVPTGAVLLRTITTAHYNPADDPSSANIYAERTPVANSSPTPLVLNAVKTTTNGAAQSRFSYDGLAFGTAPTVGLLTKEEHWDDGTASGGTAKWLATTHQYDPTYGNLTQTTDPLGNKTTLAYDPQTHAQPISVTVDPLNGTGQQTTSTAYDYSTGLVTSVTDPNQKTTSTDYRNQLLGGPDPFGRPGMVTDPLERQLVSRYFDHLLQLEVWSDLKSAGDGLLKSRVLQDQLARVVKKESSEDGASYTIFSTNVYQQMGRITSTTNPMREASAGTDGWTRTTRDEIGRVVTVETFNGIYPSGTSTGIVSTTYSANKTTVTDQAGRSRSIVLDGLGRLVQVSEDPSGLNYQTTYGYDTLGNLTSVTQGSQSRSFAFDSLSRLRQATNPENGSMNYTYDDDSNLHTRTDARNVVTTFAYDGLNRVTGRTYSGPPPGGSTPPVTYGYDSASVLNSKGRLTSVSSSVSTYSYGSYDAVGRVLTGTQTTDGQAYTMSYQYNLAGAMTSETYPADTGTVITTDYDSASRIAGVKDQTGVYYAGNSPTDATNRIQYSAHGALTAMRLRNGLVEKTQFNGRLQPTEITLGTTATPSSVLELDYDFGPTASNNGNVMSQRIVAGGLPAMDVTQNYTYDWLNRLLTANEVPTGSSQQQWQQTYDIDRYGNRAVRTTSYIPQPLLTPQSTSATDFSAFTQPSNQVNNQIQRANFVYDAAGNLTGDPTTAANAMVYDAENHMTSYTKAGVTTNYSYDGDGRRVKKSDSTGSTGTTVFVYNAIGQLLVEYTTGTPSQNGTSYLTTDHLGSTRVVTKSDGTVRARYDYLPFGEELAAGVGQRLTAMGYSGFDDTRHKFTSKERDNESNLDYFEARYLSSMQGRFTSPDEFTGGPEDVQDFTDIASDNPTMYADIHEPQSFNKYQYGYNNPLRYTDPNGHLPKWVSKAVDHLSRTVNGAVSAWAEDNGIKHPDVEQNTVGRVIGHGLALAQSFVEVNGGSEIAGAGITEVVATAPAAPTGAPAAGVVITVGGVALVAHGGYVGARTVHNIFKKGPSEPYNRRKHYGDTPTQADRKAVGGESVNHDPPLVKRYYEGDPAAGEKPGYQQTPAERRASAGDRERMGRSTRSAQRSQGGHMSSYSKMKKREHGLN